MPTSSSSSLLLVFEPRWSSQRIALTLASSVVCVGVPWLIPYWSVPARILLSTATLILLAVGYQRAGWWGSKRIVRVTWQQSGEWVLSRAVPDSSQLQSWQLLGNSYQSAWLMVLRWRGDRTRASMVILPGELSAAGWRQWQARLTLQGNHQRDTHPAAI